LAQVQKNAFMLSSATLMMAPFGGTSPFDLTPAAHSVGMANEIAVTLDSSNIDLLNGITQTVVDTKRTNVQASITASIKEFTAQNMMRALSVNGTAIQVKRGVLTANAAAAAVSLTLISDPIPGDSASDLTLAADIPAGATLLIQRVGDETVYVFPTRASAIATLSTGTFTVPIAAPYAIPAGMSFPIGSRVWVVNEVGVGSNVNDLFSVKIVGTLANFDRPVVFIAPKVSIVKGFNLSFTETEYGSMPWEMRPALLTTSEATGRLAEIGTTVVGKVYAG